MIMIQRGNFWAMGDAHRLPNNNMLIIDSTCLPLRDQLTRACHIEDLTWNEWLKAEYHPNDMPFWTRIREMRRDGDKKVLFEAHLTDPNDLVSWQTFGGARIQLTLSNRSRGAVKARNLPLGSG